MFNPDLPIERACEDVLNRQGFSKNLAKVMLDYSSPDAFAIGIYGKWGSGKTSVLNMILETIEDKSQDVVILRFNPWLCADSKQLVTQFLKQLSSAIKLKTPAKSKLWKLIDNYADVFELSGMIPVAGGILSTIGKILGKKAKAYSEQHSSDLQELKNQIIERLREAKIKIIVTIDDIDRLSEAEIISVFQLVKSLADFPYTIYVLAFDYEVVVRALGKVQNGNGKEYLEKVIQVPFEIPAPSIDDIYKFLFDKLNNVLGNLPGDKWDRNTWGELFYFGIKWYIRTIRDITRYINVFSLKYELLKDETDAVDLLGLTCLQVFEPNIYTKLLSHKEELCGDISSYSASSQNYNDKINDVKNALADILADKSITNSNAVEKILGIIFPKLRTANNSWFSAGRIYNHRQFFINNNIACPECFDRYFLLLLESGSIPTSTLHRLIFEADEATLISEIEKIYKNEKIVRFLESVESYSNAYTKEFISSERASILLKCLIQQWEFFDVDDGNEFFAVPFSWRLLFCVDPLLKLIDDKERYLVIKAIFEDEKISISTLSLILEDFENQHGRFTNEDKGKSEVKDKVFTLEQVLGLEDIIKTRIIREIDRKTLLEHDDALGLIWILEQIDSSLAAEKKGLLITDDISLAKFVHCCVLHGKVLARSVEKTWRVKREHIAECIDINEAYRRICAFAEAEEFLMLAQNVRQDIAAFLIDMESDSSVGERNISLTSIEKKLNELASC